MLLKITALPGDGIGPEVTDQAIRVLKCVTDTFGHELQMETKAIGGAALLAFNDPLPKETLEACLSSSAVLLGAVGGPAFDNFAPQLRPERGLLRLRHELGVFANLRPAICFPGLEDASPLQPSLIRGADILVVRELLGGIYFGEPRRTEGVAPNRLAIDTMRYAEPEIERTARIAFQLAKGRRAKLTSVDKANVLECSRLWRDVVSRIAAQYPDVRLNHLYVDSAAMALVAQPTDFDVLLTENMFGDILSDQAGGVVGSLGQLASASIGGRVGLYEPVHGSAPGIAGKGIANPIGAILSVALLLRHSFELQAEAAAIETAVRSVLAVGHRTRDLAKSGQVTIGTSEMGGKIVHALKDQISRKSAG
jgi:3-isopropylmalate dehydrogenase